jgi:hypothetical protein
LDACTPSNVLVLVFVVRRGATVVATAAACQLARLLVCEFHGCRRATTRVTTVLLLFFLLLFFRFVLVVLFARFVLLRLERFAFVVVIPHNLAATRGSAVTRSIRFRIRISLGFGCRNGRCLCVARLIIGEKARYAFVFADGHLHLFCSVHKLHFLLRNGSASGTSGGHEGL